MMSVPLGEIIGDFQFQVFRYTLTAVTQPVGTADATKWTVLFEDPAGSTARIDVVSPIAANGGWFLGQQTKLPFFCFREYGPWMQQQFYAIQSAAGALLNVLEVYYRPKG